MSKESEEQSSIFLPDFAERIASGDAEAIKVYLEEVWRRIRAMLHERKQMRKDPIFELHDPTSIATDLTLQLRQALIKKAADGYFKDAEHVARYIAVCVRCILVDLARRRDRREKTIVDDDIQIDFLDSLIPMIDTSRTAQEVAIETEKAEQLHQAIMQLNNDQRQILQLSMSGLTIRETAKLNGKSPARVSEILTEAKRLIAQKLKDYMAD